MREFPLSDHTRWYAAAALAALMLATRSQHFASAVHLPDASWAAFFLAGALLGGAAPLLALLGLAAATDYVAIQFGGVSAFCVSPAYGALIAAYGALYLAGRVYAAVHRRHIATLAPFAALALAGTAACELISSGSFYFLSGRFSDPSLATFGARLVRYFPYAVEAMTLYLGAAAIAYTALVLVSRPGALVRH